MEKMIMKNINKINTNTKAYAKKIEKKEENRKLKEWRQTVLTRDGNKCVICGNDNRVNCHHILAREIKQYRYTTDNGICLCCNHHKFSTTISPHKNPIAFYQWLEKEKPKQFYWAIGAIKNIVSDKQIGG